MAYDAMGLTELRDDAERVYQFNFKGNSATAPRTTRADAAWWKFWN
jgi:outer membrane protein assembly factor BamD